MAPVTEYQVGAALWVVRAIDEQGSTSAALDAAFHSAVTQGRFPRQDLENALRLLRTSSLVESAEDVTRHHESLSALLPLGDDVALQLLAELLGDAEQAESGDDTARAMLGARGEEAVAAWCVEELLTLGRRELALQVQRVSLISDRFGFDVSAPTTTNGPRKLEVKTTGSFSAQTFRFYLTRNEFDVGRRSPLTWALVACREHDGVVAILGWCRVTELERYLPDDANGRWTEALVSLPIAALFPRVPSAVG